MNRRQLFSFSHTCWIKIEVLNYREQWCSFAPENVILFIGVTRRLHLFVGDQLTSISTSSLDRVVCESSQIIKLFSYLLDKN